MISAPGRLMTSTSQIMTSLNKPTGTTGKPFQVYVDLDGVNTHAELSIKRVLIITVWLEAVKNSSYIFYIYLFLLLLLI